MFPRVSNFFHFFIFQIRICVFRFVYWRDRRRVSHQIEKRTISKMDKKAARASLQALKEVREGKVNRLDQLEVGCLVFVSLLLLILVYGVSLFTIVGR